jgi:VWFA-related protein
MRTRRGTLARLASVALLVSAGSRGAGSPASPAQAAGQAPPAVFETEVVLVAIPVFVTDGSGRAVAGLTAEDFEVEDGGRVVPIHAFQAVDVREPQPESEELPTPVRAALPRQFLLLFDLQFSPFAGVQRARATSARFVREGLADGDLVAAATYGRHGFKMLTNFTTDHEYVARAIEGLGHQPTPTLAGDVLALTDDLAPQAQPGEGVGNSALMDQEIAEEMAALTNAARQAYGRQLQDFVGTLEDIAQAVSRLAGRKQVILLSAGANESAWQGLPSTGPTSPASLVDVTARDAMARLFRAAGIHDVAIHAVNLAGLEGPVDVGSQTGRSAARRSGHDTLAALAANTGGRFVLPTNDFGRALREVEQASRSYYVLAFEPADRGGKRDRPRPLKVRVRRSGLTLSHRTAYLLPSPPASDAGQLRLAAAEAIAKGLSGGPLGLDVVAVPYRDGARVTSLSAVLQIGGEALLAAARASRLDVEVYGYAMARDRVLDRLAVKTALDLAKREASLRRDGLSVVASFAVPHGQLVDLRFFVKAGSEPLTGSVRRLLDVPPVPAAGALSASPPLVVRPLGDRMAFPVETQARRGGAPPFRVGDGVLLPVAPSLEPGQPRDLLVFVWRAAGSGRPLDVTGEVARAGEAALPVRVDGVRVVAGADGVDRCVVRVAAPQAPSGDYALRLVLRDPDTGESARAETTVSLRR